MHQEIEMILIPDPLLNKAFLQPSNDQNTNKELKRQDKWLWFRNGEIEVEGDELIQELRSLNMGKNLNYRG